MKNLERLVLVFSIIAILLSTISILGLITMKNTNSTTPVFVDHTNGTPTSYGKNGSSDTYTQTQVATIRVTGRYTEYIKPDTVEVVLGVEVQAPSSQEAFNKVSSSMQKIIEKLLELGIQEDNITTTSVSLHPVYEWRDKTSVLVGYRASNMIKIRVSNVELASKALDVSVELGATKVYGVRFHVSQEQYREIYLKALRLAVRDAKEKAQVIADELGVKITRVLSVSIGEIYIPRDISIYFESKGGSYNTPIMEGKVSVSATVTIVFEISGK